MDEPFDRSPPDGFLKKLDTAKVFRIGSRLKKIRKEIKRSKRLIKNNVSTKLEDKIISIERKEKVEAIKELPVFVNTIV